MCVCLSVFTESAHWAVSVIESRCPSVCMCVSVPCEEDLSFHWRGLLHTHPQISTQPFIFFFSLGGRGAVKKKMFLVELRIYFWGVKKTSSIKGKVFFTGDIHTYVQTYRHRDYMTELARWADSVKRLKTSASANGLDNKLQQITNLACSVFLSYGNNHLN